MVNDTEFKVVLITGALSDIGRAIAMAFAKAGYGVILNYRRKEEQARAFVNTLLHESKTSHVTSIQADVSNRKDVKTMFEQVYQVFDKVGVLINNAGINRDRSTLTPRRIDTEELRGRYQLEEVEKKTRLEQEVLLKRLGVPDEIASMMLYLVSSGQYITG